MGTFTGVGPNPQLMSIGVCYFPEHWPSERWERDVEQMAEAGIEYVRMAEFSWAVLEPERGEFDFEWLDEAVELIDDHGMKAVLCTPTASPPRWLVDERPEILQRDRDGTIKHAGSRRHYCFNSPAYREETERVVREMADHYADDPRVVGWQTDNEYGCHGTADCYCEDCADAFRDWLDERYADADELNEAWGTTFWSQQYDSIEDVDVPKPTPAQDHPSYALDFRRFTSDSIIEYNRLQTDLLEEYNDDWFVTHNFMNLFPSLDIYEMGEDLDLVSWDSYPTGHVQEAGESSHDELRAGNPDLLSFNHDLYRSILGKPFWVMEQQPGDVNWPPHSAQPAEGAMRLWAHHATAHGADAVVYFRWRRCLEAQEQYHAGLRKQDGSADRGYHDAQTAADELLDIEGGAGADGDSEGLETTDSPVAILHDYENIWAIAGQEHAPDFDYWALLQSFYRPLRARGVSVDVVHPESDLEGYDAVIAPALHMVTADLVDRLTEYAESGGQLLFGPRTGVKDEYNKFRPEPQPGPLADLVGATVDQHESAPGHLETTVAPVDADGESDDLPYRTWAEWLNPTTAEPTFEYTSEGITAGKTAAVRNTVGDGAVVYCGVQPEARLGDELIGALLERAAVSHAGALPTGVRATVRDGVTWICNFTSDEVTVELERTGEETTDWRLGGPELEPFDLSVADGDVIDRLSVSIDD